MAAAEDRLWWYRGLRRLVVSSLERFLSAGPSPLIVDVGCGTGGTFESVRAAFPQIRYVGLDIEPKALEHCRARGLGILIRGSANELPIRPESVDAVLCLDVLYYRDVDPAAVLARFFEILRPGGLLIINLPAFESLRGEHDLAVGIAHRFRAAELRRLCERTGFEIVRLTYWNAALFLPLLAWRKLTRGARETGAVSDTARSPRWLNAPLTALALLEVGLSRWLSWPWGSSVFVVARRLA